MKEFIHKRPLLAYFLLAYGITWLGPVVPVALLGRWLSSHHVSPAVLALPFICGPSVAGFIVEGALHGREGVARLWRRLFTWRVSLRWYLFALLGPALTLLVGAWITHAATGVPLDFRTANLYAYTHGNPLVTPVALLAMLLMNLLAGPLTEEFGWRGFALPRLQERLSPFAASLVLGLIWAFWHLPLFFIPGTTQAATPPLQFAVAVTLLNFLLTWLYNASGGSLLLMVILHDTFNVSPQAIPLSPAGWPAILVMAAVVLVVVISNRAAWFRRPAAATQAVNAASL